MKFYKMHGLGNDFIFIVNQEFDKTRDITNFDKKGFIKKISNRNFGIGCDQFILFSKLDSLDNNEEIYEMQIYNSDGSIASACGNASRCLGKLIFDNNVFGSNEFQNHGKSLELKNIKINVAGRVISCQKISENIMKVNMGLAYFEKDWMPQNDYIINLANKFNLPSENISCVDVGNRHIVLIMDSLSEEEAFFLGSHINSEDYFGEGINVNFAVVKDKKIFLKTYERGVGMTMACGSGACASFAFAKKMGFVNNDCEVIFEAGKLKLSFDENNSIMMEGPAIMIADGLYYDY